MKHIAFTLTEKKSYKEAIKEASKKKYNSQLIQIFTSLTKQAKIQKILNKITKDFPNAVVIGTTTAGEISQAKMYEESSVISLSLFENTKLNIAYTKKTNQKSGIYIAKKISSKHTKAAIVLSEGLQGKDYEGFIKGIKEFNPKLLISGGLAGDNFKLKKTFIIYNNKVLNKGTVALSFSGKNLYANNNYNLNWTPIGKSFTITHSEGNIVHKIDNQDAVSIFKRYLGEEIFANDAQALPDFQLLFKEGSTTVSRTPMAIDGTSLIFAAPLKKGETVQFGFSNTASVLSGADTIGKELEANPAQAIYIYSCIARKILLGKKLEREFEAFNNIAPTAGFFTYGEFYSTSANNALLNCTTTILVLSENRSKTNIVKVKQTTNSSSLDNITFSALTHFVKQTSLELEENLELLNQYKIAVDSTSLISKTDKNGVIIYVNDNFCRVSQYDEKYLLGKNHNIVRNPNLPPQFFRKMWKTIQKGKIWKGIFSNKAKDGSLYYVDAAIIPILDEKQNIKEYIAIRQDVTKQMQAKKRIEEKENLIKAIFDNQDSIVIYASNTKGMISVNKKLFDYIGYNTMEEFKANHSCICEYFIEEEGYTNPKENPNWIEDIANAKTDLTKAKMIAKDGNIYIFNIIIKKINNEYIINLYDITTLENALKKAYSSEQAKSIFLANMSHEIRTPLNGILGFTDLLTKRDLDKDSKRYIDIIHKSGQTLLNVVNDILDFSKLESGELTLYENESNLFEEMEASVSTFASVSKNKEIDYFTYIDTNIPKTLHCDIQRIKQVMNNLTSNAIKFTPENGEVSVSITLKEIKNNIAHIQFSVKDSGIGIAEDKINTIFDAFSQADNSISREFGGTGLGLSISSQYIQMMDSKLKVKSTIGEGSEFYFTLELPIVDATHQFQDSSYNNQLKIQLLSNNKGISCGVNTIISNYLDAWNWSYEEIYSLDEVNQDSDLLIVCAKLFDQKNCHDALDRYEKLQLIYIEGATSDFNCSHKKFHLVEQPMTGSSLFDMIITLTNIEQIPTTQQTNTNTPTYNGDILVAEDNETNQILISILLQERGINYTIVSNGQEAIKKALQHPYNLIFMDINMPILDGISAIKILRAKNYTQPIVSLSANVIDTDRKSFLEAGVDATLNKPIVPDELDTILNIYLGNSKTSLTSEETIEFDTVDIEKLSKQLSLNNPNIIQTLLKSFATTAQEFIKTIESHPTDTDFMHNIKGISGNLRFTNLYNLSVNMEKNINEWDAEQHKKEDKKLLLHLYNLLKQIEEL
jgi:PAS domain S-box-containing protein